MVLNWKQRIYVFLFKRLLGPLLDESSLQQLQESLQVSLVDGTLTLRNVRLNCKAIHQRLKPQNNDLNVQLRSTLIERLEIQLSLVEKDVDANSSLAWRALQVMQLTGSTGVTTATAANAAAMEKDHHNAVPIVSLLASIRMDGVIVELEPNTSEYDNDDNDCRQSTEMVVNDEPVSETSQSYLSQYIEAILSSLRLSVQIDNLSARWNAPCGERNDKWLECLVQRIVYRDLATQQPQAMSNGSKQIFNKGLDVTKVSFAVGETRWELVEPVVQNDDENDSRDGERQWRHALDSEDDDDSSTIFEKSENKTPIALLNGETSIGVMVVEIGEQTPNSATVPSTSRRLQSDVYVKLSQRLNVSLSAPMCVQMQELVQSLTVRKEPLIVVNKPVSTKGNNNNNNGDGRPVPVKSENDNKAMSSYQHDLGEAEDLKVVREFARQYEEARRMVDQNCFRGGMLLPDEDSINDADGMRFDAFFDANETGLGHFSSVLMESLLLNRNEAAVDEDDFVQTKLRFSVPEGNLKLNFCSSTDVLLKRRRDEYILLTFSELNGSGSISKRKTEITMSVLEMDIEDSLVDHSEQSATGAASTGARKVDIGKFVSFSSGRSGVLLQAPCLSLSVVTERHEVVTSTDLECTIDTVDIELRPKTMTNLEQFFKSVAASIKISPVEVLGETSKKVVKKMSLYVSCPSITLVMSVPVDVDWSSLDRRRCLSPSPGRLSRSMIGLYIRQAVMESSADEEGMPIFCFSVNHLCPFIKSVSSESNVSTLQIDLISLSGLDEIPAAVKLWRNDLDADEGVNRGVQSFPKVPVISSFKARQEDEDEDNRIDRVLTSDIEGINVATRGDLRGIDPQAEMVLAASRCDYVIEIQIPELACELTITELAILQQVLEHALSTPTGEKDFATTEADIESTCICVALECGYASLLLQSERHSDELEESKSNLVAVLLNLSKLKGHFMKDRGSVGYVRILADEVDVLHGVGIKPVGDRDLRASRHRSFVGGTVEPIVHRSHLFLPISRQSPALVFDFINQAGVYGRQQHNIHITVYDSTIRLNPDSKFKSHLCMILDKLPKPQRRQEGEAVGSSDDHMKLTRLFVSFADCNIDYSSSVHYKTPSRMMLRVGDLRLSSNLIWPAPQKQGFSIAFCDGALYLCKERFPYTFENSKIPRAGRFLSAIQVDVDSLGIDGVASADKVLAAMDYMTIGTLSSCDAIVVVSNSPPVLGTDASLQTSLTVGDLCVYACKDSFTRFVLTFSELSNDMTALDSSALEVLRSQSYADLDEPEDTESQIDVIEQKIHAFEELKRQSVLRAVPGTGNKKPDHDFLLDGYDWTTVDQDESSKVEIDDGEEQSARWYSDDDQSQVTSMAFGKAVIATPSFGAIDPVAQQERQKLRIVTHHFPMTIVSDPMHDAADMGIGKLISESAKPQTKTRILIHDLSIRFRLFDGYDWPDLLDTRQRRTGMKGSFILDDIVNFTPEEELEISAVQSTKTSERETDVRAQLLGDLLGSPSDKPSETFKSCPLPEERGALLKEQSERRRLARRTAKYVQFVASGVSVRLDSLALSQDYRLASCLNLKARDFFLAETISSDRPVKMAGEWMNDADHPRETSDGLVTMKLVTWHPKLRVTPNNEIVNDECEALVKILPLRCILDQRAIRFIRLFARVDGDDESSNVAKSTKAKGRYWFPPPLFTSFRFKPFKLKVDYRPEKLDTQALRNGAIVELVNLSPIDNMVLMLGQVDLPDVTGIGEVLALAARQWVEDVCSTQLLKFLVNSRPLEPFKTVSQGAGDLVVLPWEAMQNGESVKKALRAGMKSFSKAVVYEAFTVTSRTSEFIADQISKLSVSGIGSNALPSRPLEAPRGVFDTAPHVVESITRGLQAANYKIVVVPYREYRRTGAKGAVTSVLKGIPVAIAAPASGAAEAFSYGMLGARNHFSPDIRKEEEASLRGLHLDR